MSDNLSKDQIDLAKAWMEVHKDHVNRITSNQIIAYPPTLNEDKNNPNLWKPFHWKWFINYIEESE